MPCGSQPGDITHTRDVDSSRSPFKIKVDCVKDGTYLFTFPLGGDVLGGLRWRLLLLRGGVHDDRGRLHRGGELWLGRVVGPCWGSSKVNPHVAGLGHTYNI